MIQNKDFLMTNNDDAGEDEEEEYADADDYQEHSSIKHLR